MNKIYCTYCNAHNFGVRPQTIQTLVDHLRNEHQLPLTVTSLGDLELFRQDLNTAWFERQQRLIQKAGTPDLFKQAKYERMLQEHVATYDDNAEINEITSTSEQQTNVPEDIEAAETLVDMSNGVHRAPATPEEIALRYGREDLEAALDLEKVAETKIDDETAARTSEDPDSNDGGRRPKRRFFDFGKLFEKWTTAVRRRG